MPFPPTGFGIGPTPGSTALDQPPPSPTPMSGGPPGTSGPFSMRGISGPPSAGPGTVSSGQMPSQVLTGITQSASAVNDMFDAWAQVTPDQAALLSVMKDMLQQYLATLMSNGSGPVSPTAAGPAPPMGGMDRGLSGAGSV